MTTPLLDGFQATQQKPNLFCVDVLGDVEQVGGNTQWRKLGNSLLKYLKDHDKTAVLVSTNRLDHFLLEDDDMTVPYTTFTHEDKTYFITKIYAPKMEKFLPDITEHEQFVFGLNAWLIFQKDFDDVIIEDEMKKVISDLCNLARMELKIELLAAVSDGCEMFWFNPAC